MHVFNSQQQLSAAAATASERTVYVTLGVENLMSDMLRMWNRTES